jgi:hypothetical protein
LAFSHKHTRVARLALNNFFALPRLVKDRTSIFAATGAGPADGGQLIVNHLYDFALRFVIIIAHQNLVDLPVL